MNDDRYSSMKAVRFPDRILAIRSGQKFAPVHVQMILSDLCNQSCAFCTYREPENPASQLFHENGNYNPNRRLPTAKAMEIIDDCAEMGVKAIQFTGGGEPTVHRDFQMIADYAIERGLRWALITNGVKLDEIDASDASWIRVSVDAAQPATYSRIRRVPEAHFHKALASIQKYRCGVGFVVTEDNWREVVDAVRLYKSLGASNVRIAPHFTPSNNLGYYEEAALLVDEAVKEQTADFRVFNRFREKYAEIQAPPSDALCGYQHFTTWVGADQNVYRCCIYAYNPRGLLGSVKGRRFRDVWPEIAAGFRSFDARKCVGCHYRSINHVLAYALAEQVVDESFV